MTTDLKLSLFGQRFARSTGVLELMDDLGSALAGEEDVLMLGGGNPGVIPSVQARFQSRLAEASQDRQLFNRMFANYAPPAGEIRFRRRLAQLLRNEYGWQLTEANIALTAGSQAGFFLLFNFFAGEYPNGSKQILLPVTPEYIGYRDLGISPGMFRARRPSIEQLDDKLFKYHVDFSGLQLDSGVGAICVSRPTNPTGNVITDSEVSRLDGLARAAGVPLILDNAYGLPFPQLIYTEATPVWNDNIVLCMTLSKLGLPGVRTGIVIANEAIVSALAHATAIQNLAVTSVGAAMVEDMVASGELLRLSENEIRPFYADKASRSVAAVRRAMDDFPVHIHSPEGAMFLWLWFPGLPISSQELYRRLKARGVAIVPGHHFFPGLVDPWAHTNECIRVTYAQDQADVERGIDIIADEVRRAFAQAA